jgi:hypothetical protein
MIDTAIDFIKAHQVFSTFVVTSVWSAFISALPAPQTNSGMPYQFFFKFANYLAANISRANSTKVENSPNFQSAVNALPGPVDKPVVVVEAPKP